MVLSPPSFPPTQVGICASVGTLEIQKSMTDLLAVINSFQIMTSHLNSRFWTPSPSNTFSVSSFSALSSSPPSPLFSHKTICFSLSPSEVQAFLWKVAWNRGPTLGIIQRLFPHFALSPNFVPCASLQLNQMAT